MSPNEFVRFCQSHAPIRVLFRQGRCCPQFYCQSCERPIRNLSSAGIVFGSWEDAKEGHVQVALLLCKSSSCLNAPPIRHWLWDELRYGVVHLLQNGGVRSVAAHERLWKDTRRWDRLF